MEEFGLAIYQLCNLTRHLCNGCKNRTGSPCSLNLMGRRLFGERNFTTQYYLFSIGDLHNKSPLSYLFMLKPSIGSCQLHSLFDSYDQYGKRLMI